MRRVILISFSIITGVGVACGAADAPLGHKDFYPSDERPVGFRGDGSGWFPGATPVTQWQTATLEKQGKDYTWTTSDEKRVNIAWEVTPPGWCSSTPIIVGDRAFATYNPHGLMCIDMHTGKTLWTREHSPFVMDGKPAELEGLRDVARAIQVLVGYCKLKKGDAEALAHAHERLKAMRVEVEKLDASLLGAFDQTVALFTASKTPKNVKSIPFMQQLNKTYDIKSVFEYHQWTGWAMPVPCSDGRRVYAVYSDGQTVCYDLNGKRLWGKRYPIQSVKQQWGNNYGIVQSPMLIGDMVVVPYKKMLRAFDKISGKLAWESTLGGWQAKFNAHCARLTVNQGEKRIPLLVWSHGRQRVQRADTGQILGNSAIGYHATSVTGWGDHVFGGVGNAGTGKPYAKQRLWLDDKGVLQADDPVVFEGSKIIKGNENAVLTDRLFSRKGTVIEWGTGKMLAGDGSATPWPKGSSVGGTSMLAGNILIGHDGQRGSTHGGYRRRTAETEYGRYGTVDLSDPANPKAVAKNVLGGPHMPRMRAMERWTPELYKSRFFDYHGIPNKFAPYYTGSMFASGNRLLIMTTARIYCIGDPSVPYDWNPRSRPAEVTAALQHEETK